MPGRIAALLITLGLALPAATWAAAADSAAVSAPAPRPRPVSTTPT